MTIVDSASSSAVAGSVASPLSVDAVRRRPALLRAKSLPAEPEPVPGTPAAAAAAPSPVSPGAPSLLSRPSPALTALVGSPEAEDSVLEFVRMPVTVQEIRTAMQRNLREVSRRRLSVLALDMLLRTVASGDAVHDVLWWVDLSLVSCSRFLFLSFIH